MLKKDINILTVPDEKAFNSECPICFVEDDKMFILSCLHRFHKECLEKHTDLNCPQCRQNVVNWPLDIREKIIKNSIEFRSEIDEQDRRNILENERNRMPRNMISYISPPSHMEVSTALHYLKRRGVPMRYLCRKIDIKVQKDGPKFPGQIFSAVISSITDEMERDIENKVLEIEETDIESEEFSSDEDPFEEENSILEDLDISVRFVDV